MNRLPLRPSRQLTLALGLTLLAAPVARAQSTSPLNYQTVTVQRGDTAYSLSKRFSLSVEALYALNNMDSSALEVGQVLIVGAPTHTVRPKETVYALSRLYGVRPEAILALNTFPREVRLDIGQVVKIPVAGLTPGGSTQVAQEGGAQEGGSGGNAQAARPVPATTPLPPGLSGAGGWRETALKLLGTPYLLGGTTPTATDCSGLVLQVFSPLGVRLPRRSIEQAQAGIGVGLNELRAGDLVFFDTLGKGYVSHVGIYLGDDSFINANTYYGKVVIDRLRDDPYWSRRYVGARRVLLGALADQ